MRPASLPSSLREVSRPGMKYVVQVGISSASQMPPTPSSAKNELGGIIICLSATVEKSFSLPKYIAFPKKNNFQNN